MRVAVQLSWVKVALRVDAHFAVIVARGSATMASGANDSGERWYLGVKELFVQIFPETPLLCR
jgi:hypothetical protein